MHMYMYMYINIHIYVNVYIYVYVCVYMDICIYMGSTPVLICNLVLIWTMQILDALLERRDAGVVKYI